MDPPNPPFSAQTAKISVPEIGFPKLAPLGPEKSLTGSLPNRRDLSSIPISWNCHRSGVLVLYRFDPRLAAEGKNPFQLDSKRIKGNLQEYLDRQNRYVNLKKNNPKGADLLKSQMADNITARFNRYRRMLEGPNTKAAAPSGNHVKGHDLFLPVEKNDWS